MIACSNSRAAAWMAAASYAGVLLIALPTWGVTWDEPVWMKLGDALWDWILSGFRGPLPADPRNLFHYGALPALVTGGLHRFFHGFLGVLPSDTAHHLGNFTFAVALMAGLVVWAQAVLGPRGSLLAVFLWAAMPRLWPDLVTNPSDLPGAAGVLWASWGAWRIFGQEKPRWRDYLLWGALMGLAYGLRAPNVYFLALALAVWAAVDRWWLGHRRPALVGWGLLAAFAAFLLTVKITSPWLWDDSAIRTVLMSNPSVYRESETGKVSIWFEGRFWAGLEPARWYAPWMWLITTPLLPLLGFVGGLATAWLLRRRMDSTHLLWIVLWASAVFKHLLGLGNYDGVRHFLEAYAPQTLLASQGLLWLVSRAGRHEPGRLKTALGALIALGLAVPILQGIRLHPYQTGYFNPLAGPLSRAWERHEVDYWGQSYRPANRWARANIPKGSTIFAPIAGGLAQRVLEPEYRVHLGGGNRLDRAQPGDWAMLLNRRGAWWKKFGRKDPVACPDGWEERHREIARPSLPPLMFLCRKSTGASISPSEAGP